MVLASAAHAETLQYHQNAAAAEAVHDRANRHMRQLEVISPAQLEVLSLSLLISARLSPTTVPDSPCTMCSWYLHKGDATTYQGLCAREGGLHSSGGGAGHRAWEGRWPVLL